MIIPSVLHSHLTGASRAATSKGSGSAASVVAYIAGEKLRDRDGRWHSYHRDDVAAVYLEGWSQGPGESQAEALQRLLDTVHRVHSRVNAREGNVITVELPGGIGDEMDRVREQLARDLVARVHSGLGGAVVGAVHAPPSEGSEKQWHMHIYSTRNQVREGREYTDQDIPQLASKSEGGQFMKSLRSYCCVRFNEEADRLGLERRWTPNDYPTLYRNINVMRADERLEPLEVPTATLHEGPAVVALRRARDRGEDVEIRSVIAKKNEQIRNENYAIRERNTARIARDEAIRELHPRLAAFDELKQLGERVGTQGGLTDLEKQRMHSLSTEVGLITAMKREVLALPIETLVHLGQFYPVAMEEIISQENYQTRKRLEGLGVPRKDLGLA